MLTASIIFPALPQDFTPPSSGGADNDVKVFEELRLKRTEKSDFSFLLREGLTEFVGKWLDIASLGTNERIVLIYHRPGELPRLILYKDLSF
jgi:hypothetical protein